MNKFPILLLLLFPGLALAQPLPMSKQIKAAYQTGTRSADGQPGEQYWINGSDYQIDAYLDPGTNTVGGVVKITYYNNSPDDLDRIVLRLYQDIMKKGNNRDWSVPAEALTDGVQIDYVKVAGKEIDLNPKVPARAGRYYGRDLPVRRSGTNLSFKIDNPLRSGRSLNMEVKWSFQIPEEFDLRMGKYGPASYFVAYWYPQVAVYDDISGWDMLNYTGMQEMYNDFSNYEVRITVPDSLLVWATGELQNADEVLAKPVLKRWEKAFSSDETINLVTSEDWKKGKVLKGKGSNTWVFKAEGVPDFAFATSADYLWDAASVELEPGRRVLCQAAYPEGARFFDQCVSITRDILTDMSTNLPGIPYPYPQVTVYNGLTGGGMEFPMMANDGPSQSKGGFIELTYHEIAHTYFPFYTGINERKYAWMDEGWASFLPHDMTMRVANYSTLDRNARYYSYFANSEMDVPLMTPSIMTGSGYGVHAYSKPSLAYTYLREMMGEEKFKEVLLTYMNRWAGKHPTPFDFFNSFNDASGENLDWFWRPWFFETTPPDLSLSNVKLHDGVAELTIKNETGLPIPIAIQAKYKNDKISTFRKPASIWSRGDKIIHLEIPGTDLKSITLGEDDIPDIDTANNEYQVKAGANTGR